MSLFVLCPKGLLSFDTKAASEALSSATGALMRNKATTQEGKVQCTSSEPSCCLCHIITCLHNIVQQPVHNLAESAGFCFEIGQTLASNLHVLGTACEPPS